MKARWLANPVDLQKRIERVWDWIPDSRGKTALLWIFGIGLGIAGFLLSLDWPQPGMFLFWALPTLFAIFLLLRAEPLLWESEPRVKPAEPELADPEDPSPPPLPRPLLAMVPIKGGEFGMGSEPASDAEIREYAADWAKILGKSAEESEKEVRGWRGNEEPVHPVQITAFQIARVPLTRRQWRELMADTPDEWEKDRTDDELPATHLDWFQALEVCNALSEREGVQPCYRKGSDDTWDWDRESDGYRLPTEAEWEYACRADTDHRWFWGDDAEGAESHAWYRGNSEGRLQAVAGKQPNPWGLHDMAGLVYEWCWDWFDTYPDTGEEVTLNPAGPAEGSSRVVRGGSFENPPDNLRSANRDDNRPDDRNDNLGLRCVRSRARQQAIS
jgi:formylglycine-generating enzyme required for sulfatase activity